MPSFSINSVPQPLQYTQIGAVVEEQAALVAASLAADRVIDRFSLQAAARAILPKSRTAWCLRRRIDGEANVEVYQSKAHHGTFYGKLVTCSRLWTCPICAAKISERRSVELVELVEAHKRAGGQVGFVTLTFSHTQADFLQDLLPKLNKALKAFKSGRSAQAVRSSFGLVGTVRALEVTHGEDNGWHVHVHELWFLEGTNHYLAPAKGEEAQQAALAGFLGVSLEEYLFPLWRNACKRVGLGEPSRERGLTVQGGDYAAHYAGKWGMENELTKSHVKKGRSGRSTPWDFLRRYRDGDAGEQARASELFKEYAAAFKGQRQLVFSKGLKARYQVEDVDDETLAASQEDSARLLGSLNISQWRKVLKVEGRGELLKRARLAGWAGVLAYLDELGALTAAEIMEAIKDGFEVRARGPRWVKRPKPAT